MQNQEEQTSTSVTDCLGISPERRDEINEALATAISEFIHSDQYDKKSDAIKLAILHCKPQSNEESVMIGMMLENALNEFTIRLKF